MHQGRLCLGELSNSLSLCPCFNIQLSLLGRLVFSDWLDNCFSINSWSSETLQSLLCTL